MLKEDSQKLLNDYAAKMKNIGYHEGYASAIESDFQDGSKNYEKAERLKKEAQPIYEELVRRFTVLANKNRNARFK